MNKFTNTPREVDNYVEILNKQLYFAVLKGKEIIKLKNNINTLFFCIDDELHYENYYNDFGPLNVSCLYKYCYKLKKYLQYAKGLKSVVHYTCDHPEKKANAACLIGLFCVIYLNFHPKSIWGVLQELGPYKHFMDAALQSCGFTLRIIDCLQAIQRAMTFNFVNFEDFNVVEYDLYDKLQYGDMNWLLPRKFLAFIGPADNHTAHPPEFYIKYFLKNDIKTIIRLNAIVYNAAAFTQVGIQHFDLIFPDGSTPPRDVLLKFLTIAEMAPSAIAVHCKAGLGRTGSLIGAYLIKHYLMTAREAIAWMRLCRPGSVIGQQQLWLEKIESWLWRAGSQYRVKQFGAVDKIPKHKYGIYSKEWPLEREKIIADARKKLQVNFAKSQLAKIPGKKNISSSVDSFAKTARLQKSTRRILAEDNSTSFKNITKLLGDVRAQAERTTTLENILARRNKYGTKVNFTSAYPKSDPNDQGKFNQMKYESLKYEKLSSVPERKRTGKNTQGDKLNKIKASWYNSKNACTDNYRPHSENEKYRRFLPTFS